jgi:hypothetical protein
VVGGREGRREKGGKALRKTLFLFPAYSLLGEQVATKVYEPPLLVQKNENDESNEKKRQTEKRTRNEKAKRSCSGMAGGRAKRYSSGDERAARRVGF